ncbi:MAG: hypothetical protein SRB1_00495 [Desulfobacteraceae bacterium Eth-SRB1]|nr:MAG: hypothetical protein SRB1_00495 [Desulfobacteraceae bacterium Eth-SRB1]
MIIKYDKKYPLPIKPLLNTFSLIAFFKGFLESITFPAAVDHMRFVSYSIQQSSGCPDGTATEPMPFLASENINDWVRWNQERDKKN